MRRTAVLGCALLLVAGCGGGGGSGVKETMTTGLTEPASETTLSTTGEFREVPIDVILRSSGDGPRCVDISAHTLGRAHQELLVTNFAMR